ncbi:MAG: nucleotide exchange factor GrpE, partial [Ruminococcus callidus]
MADEKETKKPETAAEKPNAYDKFIAIVQKPEAERTPEETKFVNDLLALFRNNDAKTENAPEEAAAPEAKAGETKAADGKDDKKKKKKDLKDALAQKEAELAEQKDQHLRLMAEYQNYRNRTTEEKKKIYGDAKVDCVKELLNVMDTFERALEAPCADENYKKGVELTFTQIQKAFEKLGVTEVAALGET